MRATTFLALLLLVLAIWVAFLSPTTAPYYLVACGAVFLPLRLFRIPGRYFHIALLVTSVLVVTHLVRVPFLLWTPESFAYGKVGSVTASALEQALLKFAITAAVLFAGLSLGFAGQSANNAYGDGSRRPLLLRARVVVIALVALAVTVRAFMQLRLGLYTKFAVNPEFGFLTRLHPDIVVYPILVIYLLKYRHTLTRLERALVGLTALSLVGLIILSGSRSAIGMFALFGFIVYAADRGNFRVRISRAALIGVLGAWLLMLTFALAGPLRYQLARGADYTSLDMAVVLEGARSSLDLKAVVTLASFVTTRTSGGMDGMVVVNMHRPEMLRNVFSPGAIASRVPTKLIPRYSPEGVMFGGRAIAIAYGGEAMRFVAHSGSVGMFAALDLALGPLSYFGAFLFGAMWAAYFRITARLRDRDVRLLFHVLGMQQVFSWSLSGNFDELIPSTVIMMVLLIAYGTIVQLVAYRPRGTVAPAPAR